MGVKQTLKNTLLILKPPPPGVRASARARAVQIAVVHRTYMLCLSRWISQPEHALCFFTALYSRLC